MASGGAGGSSGSPPLGGEGGAPPSEDADLIDDMEDDNAQVSLVGSRDGFWYVGNDGTVGGTQEPVASAFQMFELGAAEREGSAFAAHMKVAGYTGWGSVIGFNFVEVLGAVMPYDGGEYCGLSFWAKAAAVTTLRLRVPDSDTHPAGGVCADPGGAGTACYDHFGKMLTFGIEWSRFEATFAELQQAGTGYHPADKKLKPASLYAVEWAIPGASKAYEIWIDDVSFLACP